MSFQCTGCGLCCTEIGKIKPDTLKKLGMEGFALESGRCKHLRFDNGCAIYETRPKICRVDVMAKESLIQDDLYYEITARLCNKMQEAADTPVKFRVRI